MSDDRTEAPDAAEIPDGLAETTIGEWLDRLATAAGPGGYACALISIAQAVALVERICDITLADDSLAYLHPPVVECRSHAGAAQRRVLELLGQAAEAHVGLQAAYLLPADGTADQTSRRHAFQSTAEVSAAVGIEVVKVAAKTADLAGDLHGRADPVMFAHIGEAAALSAAAIEAAALHCWLHLADVSGTRLKADLDQELHKHIDKGLGSASIAIYNARAQGREGVGT
ncbi:cyclodeaminase/cyclohydrolase family protein [Actinomadura sp. HBU206391]|uniref:cyclodeaminase/cyclohydrolase family protein n=1 Tax=Actinomadura sp. HBU206391 TaxID=2731692 RepID=UPI0016500DB7|nr:cyclodeaminase/cyclohydrolase family protein [Actinomadura sp. HBU206391]MBC6462161.1 cyclodeaminase/cyclohydrolase family protein [Actinomadura sp. HBU206391]